MKNVIYNNSHLERQVEDSHAQRWGGKMKHEFIIIGVATPILGIINMQFLIFYSTVYRPQNIAI